MDIPVESAPYAYGAWPVNELEQVLSAALAGGAPSAAARVVEVLARSHVWVPLPNGGSPGHPDLDLPTLEIAGQAYVPVFSSEQQYRQVVGGHMACTVAPAVEFARGLPPQLGIALNPDGAVGIPLPPPAVAELCRAGRTELDGAGGGRVRLFPPDWQDDPLDFLTAAAEEFAATGVVTTARRCLASVEGGPTQLFVGVQTDRFEDEALHLPMAALGRALGRVPVRWEVNLILLDVARDPVTDWMRDQVRPFYARATPGTP
ncbi:enhanced serine sensitivity protein SseB C-terminal domain-containing protein [Streptomyces sp. NPDC050560]|uniref:enhanced serine sensitivity protein SseB C-terminal domain-containing protein n=1 Tax=Streptomyces sp. NPDC050560 TaxID=3365630 RepID=UPI00379D1057